MSIRLRSYYNYIFLQKDLPKWIIYLNYGSLLGILPWPLVAFGSIFMFDNPKNINTTYLEVGLIVCYPILLMLITFISFRIFKFSRLIAAFLPISILLFYLFLIIKYLLPRIA